MAETAKLSEALNGKFKLNTGHHAGKYSFKGKEIDLTTVSSEEAEQLVKDGFDVLVAVKPTNEVKKS
jgi:hypothetical protein